MNSSILSQARRNIITTARLRLIPLDISDLQELLGHPESLHLESELRLAPALVTPQIEHALEAKVIKMHATDPEAFPWFTYWLMIITSGEVGAGLVGFKGKPDETGSVEFGYGIAEDYQNRGYMTEAVQGMIQWAFAHTDCRRITAETLQTNLPSQRVLEKNGFRLYKTTSDTFEWELYP